MQGSQSGSKSKAGTRWPLRKPLGAPPRTFQESLAPSCITCCLTRTSGELLILAWRLGNWDLGRTETYPCSQRPPHPQTPPTVISPNQPDTLERGQSYNSCRIKPNQQPGGNAHKPGHGGRAGKVRAHVSRTAPQRGHCRASGEKQRQTPVSRRAGRRLELEPGVGGGEEACSPLPQPGLPWVRLHFNANSDDPLLSSAPAPRRPVAGVCHPPGGLTLSSSPQPQKSASLARECGPPGLMKQGGHHSRPPATSMAPKEQPLEAS